MAATRSRILVGVIWNGHAGARDGRAPSRAVLCAVDDSPEALEAVGVAARLAAALGLRPVLLHVGRIVPVPRTRVGEAVVADALDELRGLALESGERLLDRHVEASGTGGWARRVEIGAPAEVIASCAEEEDAALVVMGSRGRGPLAGAVLGSVSADVLASLDRPVVVVPPNVAAESAAGSPDGAVVCGVDGTRAGVLAAGLAGAISAGGARLLLAHVAPMAARGPAGHFEVSHEPDLQAGERRRAAAAILQDAVESNGLGDRAELRVVPGETVPALTRLARDEAAQLLVIGRRLQGRLKRAALGDTAVELIGDAPCPVAVAPPADTPAGAGGAPAAA